MIFYHGTYRSLPNLAYGSKATSSLMDACAWAKLKCDKEGVPVSDAHIFKLSVDNCERYGAEYREKGVQHIAVRHPTIKKVYDYNDLRGILSPEEWNVLHASTSWLNTFVDHSTISVRGRW